MKNEVRKHLWMWVALLATVIGMALASCGDDEEDTSKNTQDVAVTGTVSEVGANYAIVNGVVNLDAISASYTSVEVGVEVSTTQDFADSRRTQATDVVGRTISVRVGGLKYSTMYYYRTYVSISSLSFDYYGKTLSFTTQKAQGDNGSHVYVDLGLPSGTLWATTNIGAENPEDYGLYFAWGETTGYTQDTSDGHSFYWPSYKWCNGDYDQLTKYCNDSYYGYNGFTDTLTELEPEDDAAYVNWGSGWRMPSKTQFDELINSSYTTTTWTTQNGVYGRKITSKSNGNSLFLPAAGYRGDTSLSNAGSVGYYRSRTLTTYFSDDAYYLYFGSGNIYADHNLRSSGYSVRPVLASSGTPTIDLIFNTFETYTYQGKATSQILQGSTVEGQGWRGNYINATNSNPTGISTISSMQASLECGQTAKLTLPAYTDGKGRTSPITIYNLVTTASNDLSYTNLSIGDNSTIDGTITVDGQTYTAANLYIEKAAATTLQLSFAGTIYFANADNTDYNIAINFSYAGTNVATN